MKQELSSMHVLGPQMPSGTVQVSGAKNAATRMMCAAMLTDETVHLLNFPTELIDARYKARFIESLAGNVFFKEESSSVHIDCSHLTHTVPRNYHCPVRTTYLLAAGQLLRQKKARIPYPGGCDLGSNRKYDLHIMVWETLGCRVQEKIDHIEITGQLHGADIHFPILTVGGTENAILCGAIAAGTTRIHNAYITPEIKNLIDLLILMGAKISMQGAHLIEIEGVTSLKGATLPVIPDRIEALTWIIFAAISGGNILIEDVPFESMEIPLTYLKNAGINLSASSRSILVSPQCISEYGLQPFEMSCGTYPGVISDMQPFFVLLALHTVGRSVIVDDRYPHRTAYLDQLSRLYPGSIDWKPGHIVVNGGRPPVGASVIATDLRGSMALVLAGILAKGESCIKRTGIVLRGYNRIEMKMEKLGIHLRMTQNCSCSH